jgi:hypothetical protein
MLGRSFAAFGGGGRSGLVWFLHPSNAGRHICAQSKRKRAARSPGVVQVGPCMCWGCVVFHILLVVAVDRVTSARTNLFLKCSRATTPWPLHRVVIIWARHHTGHIASNTPGPVANPPLFLNTSWHKGAGLLRRTINVLFGKKQ